MRLWWGACDFGGEACDCDGDRRLWWGTWYGGGEGAIVVGRTVIVMGSV